MDATPGKWAMSNGRGDSPTGVRTRLRRRRVMLVIGLLSPLAGLLAATPAAAAQITVKVTADMTFVAVSGELVRGDADAFAAAIASLTAANSTIVTLDSPGGLLFEGLSIGETVRRHGYATAVLNNAQCASACGLVWLAGKTRYIARHADVGFHAAYVRDGDQTREAGAANAVVGGYLSKLGLTYEEIIFFTSAPPDGMQWLRTADWQRLGLAVSLLPDPTPAPPPAAAAAAPDVDASPERRAMAVIQSYYTLWSWSGATMELLAPYYGDTVLYYGTPETQAKVMAGKAAFTLRWPQRRYTLNTPTLFAQCDAGICSVSGVVAWDTTSPARNERSSGAANFVVKLALNDSPMGGIILSENGAVLSGHKEPMVAAP